MIGEQHVNEDGHVFGVGFRPQFFQRHYSEQVFTQKQIKKEEEVMERKDQAQISLISESNEKEE